MDKQIISTREIQRNYRGLVDRARKTKQPVYLGARSKAEVVLLDVGEFENLKNKAQGKKITWPEMKARLDWIASGGKQNTNLAKFIHDDRQRH